MFPFGGRWSRFFDASDYYTGPALSGEMVAHAEAELGFQLPETYLALLRRKNGGVPRRQSFPVSWPDWPENHVRIMTLFGIGGEWGIDSPQHGSKKMIREAGFPEAGIVLGWSPTAGHDAFFLDYLDCGPSGEPCISFIDSEEPGPTSRRILAPNLTTFLMRLSPSPPR